MTSDHAMIGFLFDHFCLAENEFIMLMIPEAVVASFVCSTGTLEKCLDVLRIPKKL